MFGRAGRPKYQTFADTDVCFELQSQTNLPKTIRIELFRFLGVEQLVTGEVRFRRLCLLATSLLRNQWLRSLQSSE